MEYPDEYLPARQVGLQDLLDYSAPMFDNDWSDDLVALQLAGRYNVNDDQQERIYVNPTQGMEPASLATCDIKGDFDSLIGLTTTLPLRMGIAVSPVPSFRDTLKKPVQINHRIMRGGVCLISA